MFATGDRVRFIGIDTPERGQCGYREATRRVRELADGRPTVLVGAPGRDNRDRYGRLLRYVIIDGRDIGKVLLDEGLAHARYDSRDGYGDHPQQAEYRRIDADTRNPCG